MIAQAPLSLILGAFCLAAVYGAIADVTTYTIPNWVSYGLALLFIPFAALAWSEIALLLHLAIGLLVFVICLVFWKLAWLGGGDVKFIGALSLWMGPENILLFTILLCLLSVIFVAILQFVRQWNAYIQASGWPRLVKQMVDKAEQNACPYGLPAAVAALAVAPGMFAKLA